jgi:hypothetical protein
MRCVENEADVEMSLAGWTNEQRESLAFLLEDTGIRCRWHGDVVFVPPAVEHEVRRFVEYLSSPGNAEGLSRADGGLVYPLFEGSECVTITDATPDDVFSFCFSDVEVPRAFAGLGEVSPIEHDAEARFKVKVSTETRAGTLERVYEEIERARPGRLVARATDSWGEIWRETWTFDGRGPDTVVSLMVDVEVADPARTPDQMRSFRSDWFAHRYAARRLGSIKTEYELGSATAPQSF